MKDALVGGFRRSLIYPLYRNWKLSKKAFKDTRKIFRIGNQNSLYFIKVLRAEYPLCTNSL